MKRRYRKIANSVFSFSVINHKKGWIYNSFLLLFVTFLTIGYSAFNQQLDIMELTTDVRPVKMIRIANIREIPNESSEGVSSLQDYDYNNVGISVSLPYADSYATYEITVASREFVDVGILNITNIPNNLNYEIIDYELEEKLCDEQGRCNVSELACSSSSCTPIVYSKFKLKFSYKEDGYNEANIDQNILAYFDFRVMHNVTYLGFRKEYKDYVIDGGTYDVTFDEIVRRILVSMDGTPLDESEYTFENKHLVIPNVTGDLFIDNNSIFTIYFDKQGGTGLDKLDVRIGNDIPNISVPLKPGYSFKGYYTALEGTVVDGYQSYLSETRRITFSNDPNWYLDTNDVGRRFQFKYTYTDETLDNPPNRVEFNDLPLKNVYIKTLDNSDWKEYTIDGGDPEASVYIIQTAEHSWTYYGNIILSSDMIKLRGNYDYTSAYRFIDMEGCTSQGTLDLSYARIDNAIYFNSNGTSVFTNDLIDDITLYAKWIDDIKPDIQYTLTFDVNTGDTYTSGTWTNRAVYSNLTVTEEGSGLNENLIQYSINNGETWNAFQFGASGLEINNGIYTGSELWTPPSPGGLREVSALFRACDNENNCEQSGPVSIKYDLQNPTISNVSFSLTGNGIKVNATVSDGEGSGINNIQYASSSSNSCSGVTYQSSSTIVPGSNKYACIKVTDNVGNITETNYYISFMLTLNASGGTIPSTGDFSGNGTTVSKSVAGGDVLSGLPTPTKSGYVFKGWTTNPKNYVALESITSDGYEFIDTGYADPNGIRAVYKASFATTTGGYIVGSHNEASPYGRNGVYWSERTQWEFGYGEICPGLGSGTTNVVYEVDFKTTKTGAYIRVNLPGESGYIVNESYSGQTISSYNNYLFFNQYSENLASTSTIATLYYVKIYSSTGTLSRDFIPAMRISDGVVGVYDKVTNTFFESKRAGTFAKGTIKEMISSSAVMPYEDTSLYAVWADETPPVISSVTSSPVNTTTLKITVNASDAASGIKQYAYGTITGSDCTTASYIPSDANTYNIAYQVGQTACVRVKDKNGNVSYSSVVPTVYTWKKYNLAYELYDTGQKTAKTFSSNYLNCSRTCTNNNDGTFKIAPSGETNWSNGDGVWMHGDNSTGTGNVTSVYHIDTVKRNGICGTQIYLGCTWNVNLSLYKVRTIQGADTGTTVTSIMPNAYPDNGKSGNNWYIKQ